MKRIKCFLFFSLLFLLFFSACAKKPKSLSETGKKLFIEAKYQFIRGNFHHVVNISEKILSENPNFVNAHILKIKSFYYLRKPIKSLSQIKIVEKNNPLHPNLRFWKAMVFKRLGKIDKSLKILKSLTLEDSYNFRAHYELAKIYKIKKKYKEALIAYQTALSIEPALLNTRLSIVEIYYDLGLKEKAKKRLKDLEKSYIGLSKGSWVFKKYEAWKKKFNKPKK